MKKDAYFSGFRLPSIMVDQIKNAFERFGLEDIPNFRRRAAQDLIDTAARGEKVALPPHFLTVREAEALSIAKRNGDLWHNVSQKFPISFIGNIVIKVSDQKLRLRRGMEVPPVDDFHRHTLLCPRQNSLLDATAMLQRASPIQFISAFFSFVKPDFSLLR